MKKVEFKDGKFVISPTSSKSTLNGNMFLNVLYFDETVTNEADAVRDLFDHYEEEYTKKLNIVYGCRQDVRDAFVNYCGR